jgi:transposase
MPILMDIGPDVEPRAMIGDKGYASKANREAARTHGAIPVIPHKSNEKHQPAWFASTLYRGRARIEQAVGKLKRFKRIALRWRRRSETSLPSSPWQQASSWSNPSTPPNGRNPVKTSRRGFDLINGSSSKH